MSKVNDIKSKMRSKKHISPSFALNEEVLPEETKERLNSGKKEEKKKDRKRVSFDLRTDLHKELKMQSLLQEKNIYLLIEEALEQYLK
ncbi:hypothetical protein SAMN05443252_1183 [Bacillus sp. OV322]|uniref:hypothetical protein n=1 Tax=Bacillus sp. OV322 TaxID=1882764 RepID=UPI0008F15E89|nr:hypothetical protein [Bacillus sp. OV322]SFD03680.1 hypothetical protein SAMN05443252_1183 [Bacillus sp. OV322]